MNIALTPKKTDKTREIFKRQEVFLLQRQRTLSVRNEKKRQKETINS